MTYTTENIHPGQIIIRMRAGQQVPVLVTDVDEDIKNGSAGFVGTVLQWGFRSDNTKFDQPVIEYGEPVEMWGYMDQIIRIARER